MTRIDSSRWAEVSPLLDELLDADDAQRGARLQQIRRDDAKLRSAARRKVPDRPTDSIRNRAFFEAYLSVSART